MYWRKWSDHALRFRWFALGGREFVLNPIHSIVNDILLHFFTVFLFIVASHTKAICLSRLLHRDVQSLMNSSYYLGIDVITEVHCTQTTSHLFYTVVSLMEEGVINGKSPPNALSMLNPHTLTHTHTHRERERFSWIHAHGDDDWCFTATFVHVVG